MEEWKEYRLGKLCNIFTGKKDVNQTTADGCYPFFSCAPTPYKSNEYIHDGQAVIVAGNGSFTGRVSYYVGKFDLYQRTYACTPIVDTFDFFYLYYYLKAFFEPKFMGGTRGSSIPYIVRGDLSNFIVRLPSTVQQQRIASILSSLDDKIELNRRINENLEAQAQALFKSWFVDFEPFRDGEFVESELGMIPKGWRVGTLGEITEQQTKKVGGQENIKVLSPVTTGKLMLSEEYFTKQVFSESIAKYKIVEIGDFAYNPARVNIGSLGRNEYLFRGCVSPVYVVFSCKEGYANFFDLYRQTERFQTEVKSRAIGGVRQSLNYSDFCLIQSLIPCQEVVNKFNPLYNRIVEVQKHLEDESRRLATLRDTLLPRLMSGELKVKELNN